MHFDKSQLRCITSDIEKPLMILAGPGSGKTRTLIGRIKFLLDKGVPAEQILAICFSRKASHEVQDRVCNQQDAFLTSNINDLTVRTFHSLCLQILRHNSDRVEGVNKKFVVITSKAQRVIIRKILAKSLEDGEKVPNEDVTSMVNQIGKVKVRMGSEIDDDDDGTGFSEFLKEYNTDLRKKNGMDFSDLIIETGKLFDENEDVLDEYREKYKYVLCDEFQDLNRIQYNILKHLTSKSGRVTIVGDEDQSIYRFRGGTAELFADFREDFPTRSEHVLEQNYRSTSTIVSASKQVIEVNEKRTPKTLFSTRMMGEKIRVVLCAEEMDEVKFIVREVMGLRGRGEKYKDIAILCRQRKSILKLFEEELKAKGIPLLKTKKRGINERLVSSTILSYLGLVINKDDDVSFLEIHNVPSRKLGVSFRNYITAFQDELTKEKGKTISLYETCKEAFKQRFPKTKNGNLKPPNKTGINNLKKFIKAMRKFREKSKTMGLFEFIGEMVASIDLETEMNKKKKSEGNTRKYALQDMKRQGKRIGQTDIENDEDFDFNYNLQENLEQIKKLVITFRKDVKVTNEKNVLKKFIDYVRGLQREDEIEEEKDAIFCSTIHQAKGLEWKYVFVVRANEGITPSSKGKNDEDSYEEERRLFYVAMSRGKDYLTISCLHNEKKFPTSYLDDINPNFMDLSHFGKYKPPGEEYKFKGKRSAVPVQPVKQSFQNNAFQQQKTMGRQGMGKQSFQFAPIQKSFRPPPLPQQQQQQQPRQRQQMNRRPVFQQPPKANGFKNPPNKFEFQPKQQSVQQNQRQLGNRYGGFPPQNQVKPKSFGNSFNRNQQPVGQFPEQKKTKTVPKNESRQGGGRTFDFSKDLSRSNPKPVGNPAKKKFSFAPLLNAQPKKPAFQSSSNFNSQVPQRKVANPINRSIRKPYPQNVRPPPPENPFKSRNIPRQENPVQKKEFEFERPSQIVQPAFPPPRIASQNPVREQQQQQQQPKSFSFSKQPPKTFDFTKNSMERNQPSQKIVVVDEEKKKKKSAVFSFGKPKPKTFDFTKSSVERTVPSQPQREIRPSQQTQNQNRRDYGRSFDSNASQKPFSQRTHRSPKKRKDPSFYEDDGENNFNQNFGGFQNFSAPKSSGLPSLYNMSQSSQNPPRPRGLFDDDVDDRENRTQPLFSQLGPGSKRKFEPYPGMEENDNKKKKFF